jgi:hypothetical protein
VRALLAAAAAAAALAAGASGAVAAVVVPDGGFVVQGSTADTERQIDIAQTAGARWVSIAVSWEALQPAPTSDGTPGTPGDAAWSDLQDRLAYASAHGMNVEVRLSDAPGWASGRDGVSDDPPTPAALPRYADFLTLLGTRLGRYIDAYSPWNEPNRVAFWNPVDADAFTALQKVAYPAIKAADPTATVIYGPVVGRYLSQNTGYAFLRRSYELGLRGYADVIGWNGYPGGEPESSGPVEDGVPAANTLPAQLYLRGLIDRYDPGRKVWLMEIGWSTCVSCNVSAANGVSEAQQADYLTRAFDYRRRYLSSYVERIFWYQVRDTGTDRGDWFQNQGVVRNDYSPKPALAAFRALGVEVPDGSPADLGEPAATPSAPIARLPVAAARLALPATRTTARRRITIGVPRLTASRGVFVLRVRVVVRGGASRLRLDGYRGRHWRAISRLTLRRSGMITFRIRDKGFVGFRLRAPLPGGRRVAVGRVIRVPPRYLRARP